VRETILYQDNRDLRRYLHGLRSEQLNVVLAVDGEDALAKAREYRPDLIRTHQMMARMIDRDLLRAIRGDPHPSDRFGAAL
jgi:CheY-like chemotaxis protein